VSVTTAATDALVSLLTALADDELILGHRHSEWTGFAPHIEEDVAFSSIAQDEIGHAGAYYMLIAEATGDDPDRLALGRGADEYRNAILCERNNRDWAYTLARHWLYDNADAVRLEALEQSSHKELAALSTKIRREERYHLIHGDAWMTRVAGGPIEGRTKLIDSLTETFPESVALFEPSDLEQDAVNHGWLPVPSAELTERFIERTGSALDELGLPTEVRSHIDQSAEFVASSSGDLIEDATSSGQPEHAPSGFGGRRGKHSEEFQPLWEEMTSTYRSDPGATW
jgi:ring-1,2-phenylacetyl-CoA epoxidase subunit PaaC